MNDYTDKVYVFSTFDEAEPVPGTPQGCLWGFYDRNGVKDQIGCEIGIRREVYDGLMRVQQSISLQVKSSARHAMRFRPDDMSS